MSCGLRTVDCAPRTVHIHAYLIYLLYLIYLIYLLLIYPLLIYRGIYRWLGLAPAGGAHLVRADRAEGGVPAAALRREARRLTAVTAPQPRQAALGCSVHTFALGSDCVGRCTDCVGQCTDCVGRCTDYAGQCTDCAGLQCAHWRRTSPTSGQSARTRGNGTVCASTAAH